MHVPFTRPRNANAINESYCAKRGHMPYRPTGPDALQALDILHHDITHRDMADQNYWLCLRCQNLVPCEPTLSGPLSKMPEPKRGLELKQRRTMRLMACDRAVRTILLTVAALTLWLLHRQQATLQTFFGHYLPVLNNDALGLHFNLESSAFETFFTKVINLHGHAYHVTLLVIAAYALIQGIEAVGLWRGTRFGEYWSFIWTAAFIPLEVIEVVKHASYFKLAALAINVAIVVWLMYRKRLPFGFRGGSRALKESYKEASIVDVLRVAPQPA